MTAAPGPAIDGDVQGNLVANFLDDTRIEVVPGEPECLRAALSPHWAVWGPSGGDVAAIALRAAMSRSRLPRPASFQCHFLAVGEFAPVEILVQSLGGGKRAESLRVEVLQNQRVLVAATVWMVADGLEGIRARLRRRAGRAASGGAA